MALFGSFPLNGLLEQMQPSRPQKLLSQLGKDYPKIWKIVDDMVSERGKSLQMAAAAAIASGGCRGPINQSIIADISRIGALIPWKVAFTIGTALQQARSRTSDDSSSETHATPAPHIRKAHWSPFWKGPKDSPAKRYLVVYWLPPIPVGIKDLELLMGQQKTSME